MRHTRVANAIIGMSYRQPQLAATGNRSSGPVAGSQVLGLDPELELGVSLNSRVVRSLPTNARKED